MKETKNNEQKSYKIRIYKDFEFPSFVLSKTNTLQDLYFKSLEELEENFKPESDYFKMEVIKILPFALSKPIEEDDEIIHGNVKFFIREVVINELEEKYGKLDYRDNPDIYDKSKVTYSGVDHNSPYNLKPEIENFFSDRYNHYTKIFTNKMI